MTSRAPGRLNSRLAAVGILLLSCAIVASNSATADDLTDKKRAADAQVSQLHDSLEGTTTELATAYVKLQQTQSQLPGARASVAAARTTLTNAQTAEKVSLVRAEDVKRKLAVAQANEARTSEAVSRSTAAISSTQEKLDLFAADVFQSSNDTELSVALGATTPEEFAERLVLADAVTAQADSTLTDLRTAEADGAATKAYLESVREEVAGLKTQADNAVVAAREASAQAVSAKASAESAQANLEGLEASQKTFAATVEQRKASEEAQLVQAEAAQRQLQAEIAERARKAREEAERRRREEEARQRALAEQQRQSGGSSRPVAPRLPSTSGGSGWSLSNPANGPITSGFGMRYHPVLQRWMLHDGIDYGIGCGTPLYATADGEIFKAGMTPNGWGNQVLVDHGIHRGSSVVTSYNHMSRIVAWGGSVSRGQLIGYSGTTGYSTGCHLHFGVYVDGRPVNPMGWL